MTAPEVALLGRRTVLAGRGKLRVGHDLPLRRTSARVARDLARVPQCSAMSPERGVMTGRGTATLHAGVQGLSPPVQRPDSVGESGKGLNPVY